MNAFEDTLKQKGLEYAKELAFQVTKSSLSFHLPILGHPPFSLLLTIEYQRSKDSN
jgi:hypothetical protein